MDEELLASLIGRYSAAITCFCFMGGDAEPMEVQRLAGWIRQTYPQLKTAWYSGRETLPDGFDVQSLDYLKLGPYIKELGGLKSPTTNQMFFRIHPDGYKERIYLY